MEAQSEASGRDLEEADAPVWPLPVSQAEEVSATDEAAQPIRPVVRRRGMAGISGHGPAPSLALLRTTRASRPGFVRPSRERLDFGPSLAPVPAAALAVVPKVAADAEEA